MDDHIDFDEEWSHGDDPVDLSDVKLLVEEKFWLGRRIANGTFRTRELEVKYNIQYKTLNKYARLYVY